MFFSIKYSYFLLNRVWLEKNVFQVPMTVYLWNTVHRSQKKDTDRRKGKGHRCCFVDRIYSIPCRSSYFAIGRFEEQYDLHQDDLKKSKSLQFKIASIARNCKNSVYQTGATTFAFSSVFILHLFIYDTAPSTLTAVCQIV